MTTHTIRIPIPLHKRLIRVKGIPTFSAKEVSNVPLRASSHNNLAFNRRLTALATRAKELMEVEVTEKPNVDVGVGWNSFGYKALVAVTRGFGVECDALQWGGTLVAAEAFWVEHGFELGWTVCA
jgi:hypothetical protein